MASKKYAVDIDLAKNSLNNARIQNLSSDPSSPVTGQAYYNTTTNRLRVYDGTAWIEMGSAEDAGVSTVNGRTGAVVLAKSDVGLSNVDNTTDLLKPISTATQTALDLKADESSLATVATTGSYDDLSNKPTFSTDTLTGTTAIVDASADAGFGADNTLYIAGNNQAAEYFQVVSPQGLSFYSDTGTDGSGSWKNGIVLGNSSTGNDGITLSTAEAGDRIQLQTTQDAASGIKIDTTNGSAGVLLKVDNMTQERQIQFPDAAGTLALTSDIGVPESISGSGGTLTASPDVANFTDTLLISAANPGSFTQLVAPTGLGFYANAGADGSGLWDKYLLLDMYDGVMLGSEATGDYVGLTADNGVRIRKNQGDSIGGNIKIDNLTAARVYQLPNAGGTIALTGHTHVAADVTDFQTAVSANTDVAANTAARHTHSNSAVLDATTASFTTADETKLDGIATGATANATDAQLRDRSTHTGTQAASTISDFSTAADARISAAAGVSIASLSGGKIPTSQIPALALVDVNVVATQAAQLALTAQEGDVAIRSDLSKSYIHNGGVAGTMADWTELSTPTDAVTSVNGQTGIVVLGKSDVGLGNVDNTSDADKPVSTAQATAIALKMDKSANLSDVANAATAFTNIKQAASTTATGVVELATTAEAEAKTDTARAVTPASLTSFTRKYVGTIGNGTLTALPVTHGLGSQYVTAQVFDATTNEMVEAEVVLTSATVTTFNFNVAPTTNQYRVVIVG